MIHYRQNIYKLLLEDFRQDFNASENENKMDGISLNLLGLAFYEKRIKYKYFIQNN